MTEQGNGPGVAARLGHQGTLSGRYFDPFDARFIPVQRQALDHGPIAAGIACADKDEHGKLGALL